MISLMRLIGILLVSCWLISFNSVTAETPATTQSAHLTEQVIADLLLPIKTAHDLPSLAGAIVTSNGVIAIGAVGVRKKGTDVAVTKNDLWHIGSNTKAMTATIIAKLVEEKKLRWDSNLIEIFPDIAKEFDASKQKMTLTQLLSHHSGLPANLKWGSFAAAGNIRQQRSKVVAALQNVKLESEPGEKFLYSNLGYVIAGAMAEKVTNKPWEELIAKIIFEPLEMKSAGFGGVGTIGKVDQPWPHYSNGSPAKTNGPLTDNPAVIGPAGTVHVSLADYSKFIAEQLKQEKKIKGLVSFESYKKLHTPPFEGDYALGWIVSKRPWAKGKTLSHAGSNTMNYLVVWIAPNRDAAFIACTNQGGDEAAKACDEAVSAMIRKYLP